MKSYGGRTRNCIKTKAKAFRKVYSRENAWAQLINIEKHSSHDDPPDYPFFRGRKQDKDKQKVHLATTMSPSINSPSKRIHACSELFNQLLKVGDLLEKDALHKSIMTKYIKIL